MNRNAIRVVAISIVLALVGCDAYKASSKAGQVVATTVTNGFQTILTMQKDGQISTSEALNLAGYLEFANLQDENFLTCSKIAHTNGNVSGSYTACATTFLTNMSQPSELSLIHVSNAASQAKVQTIVSAISSAISIYQSSIGGA